jgi:hypothetical protein
MLVLCTNVIRCGGRFGSFAFAEALAFCVGAKANVRLAKIELKKMCGGENKKYRRVGKECRLTRCTFEIWSVCFWSPVKMVFLCFNVQILVVQLSLKRSSYNWL